MHRKLYKYDLGDRHKTKLQNGWIYIKFETTKYCNFQCDYCCVKAPKFKDGQEFEFNSTNFNKVIRFLKIQKAKGIIFEFFGGEPTLDPNLKFYMEELKSHFKKNLVIILMTNLSAPVSYYESLPQEIEILVGYHSAYYKVENYIKKAIRIQDRFESFLTTILLHEKNWEEVYSRIADFKKAKLYVNVLPLIKNQRRADDLHKVFDTSYFSGADVVDQAFNIVSEEDAIKYNKFTGMFCWPNINIMSDGRIEICTRKNEHIESPSKLAPMVLCAKRQCSECEKTNPKISIEYAKQHGYL